MSPRNPKAYNVADVEPNSFGGILRRYREEAGLSQDQLGDLVGVKQSRISTYERGMNMPEEDKILQLANALNIPPGLLFEAGTFGPVVAVGEERRKRLSKLEPADWRIIDHTVAAIGDITPEERARFERKLAAFLKTWHES